MPGFVVGSVGEVVSAVRALGAEVIQEPTPYPWGVRSLLVDPDGRTVEVFERPDGATG